MSQPRSTNKLCKLGRFYIEHNLHLSNDELANYLNVSTSKIEKHRTIAENKNKELEVERLRVEEEEKQKKLKEEIAGRETEQQEVLHIRADDLMIKNERYGSVVMTSEASQLGDALRKANVSEKISKNITEVRPKRIKTV